MVNVGIIGLGGISSIHLGTYNNLRDKVNIVARCDIQEDRAKGTSEGLKINIGGGTALPVEGTPYTDYHDLIADPTVEVVDICLPTYLHAEVAVAALQGGKHVLCEKPMAMNVAECDRMIEAANASGKSFMIAHCIRFWSEYVYLKELKDSYRYGKLLHVQFNRLSELPTWSWTNWLADPTRSGGAILDLHIHDTDYIAYLCGIPSAVTVRGFQNENGISYVDTAYQYGDTPKVTAIGGWDFSPKFPFRMTFTARFEGASVEWNFPHTPLTVYPDSGDSFVPDVLPGDGYSREIEYFIDCVARGEKPSIVTPMDARESVRIVEAERQAFLTGMTVSL